MKHLRPAVLYVETSAVYNVAACAFHQIRLQTIENFF